MKIGGIIMTFKEMIYNTLMDMEKNEFDEVEYYKSFLIEIYESSNLNVKITYKSGRYAAVNENTIEITSCSIEQAIHDMVNSFLHNNPEYKIEIVKIEAMKRFIAERNDWNEICKNRKHPR